MTEPTDETRRRAIHLLDVAARGGSPDYEDTALAMGWAESLDDARELDEVKLAFAAWFLVQEVSGWSPEDEFWDRVELEAAAYLRDGNVPPKWETSGLGG